MVRIGKLSRYDVISAVLFLLQFELFFSGSSFFVNYRAKCRLLTPYFFLFWFSFFVCSFCVFGGVKKEKKKEMKKEDGIKFHYKNQYSYCNNNNYYVTYQRKISVDTYCINFRHY